MKEVPPVKLTPDERKAVMKVYFDDKEFNRRLIAHFILLLDDGHAPEKIADITFSEVHEVEAALKRYRETGLEGII